jgi:hypothetical protein
MVSDTVIGYSLFRSSTSLFFHYASKFPHLWSDSSTISFFYALRAPQYEISKFVFWDTVSALILGIPPLIQYDTTVHSVDTDEQSALEWVYGCPLAVAILLAKINAWRVPKSNRNTGLDPFERREIGIRLQQWCPMPVYIEDNACNVIARLAVHECWRQAVLVYLYMVCLFSNFRLAACSLVIALEGNVWYGLGRSSRRGVGSTNCSNL